MFSINKNKYIKSNARNNNNPNKFSNSSKISGSAKYMNILPNTAEPSCSGKEKNHTKYDKNQPLEIGSFDITEPSCSYTGKNYTKYDKNQLLKINSFDLRTPIKNSEKSFSHGGNNYKRSCTKNRSSRLSTSSVVPTSPPNQSRETRFIFTDSRNKSLIKKGFDTFVKACCVLIDTFVIMHLMYSDTVDRRSLWSVMKMLIPKKPLNYHIIEPDGII